MRIFLALLSSTALAACGGAGVQTVSGTAVPSGPTGSPTSGGSSATPTGHTFVNPTEVRTYQAIGGVQSYQYTTSNDADAPAPGVQYNRVYAANASTARSSDVQITFSPRDAIFEIIITDPLANVDRTIRFQDPAHRTAFGGALEPQGGVPDLTSQGVTFLQTNANTGTLEFNGNSPTFPTGRVDSIRDSSTFFFQRPGTVTSNVTFAGYVRNRTDIVRVEPQNAPAYVEQRQRLERGVFVYGERTPTGNVPRTGTATFNGPTIGSLVYNPQFDIDPNAPTYFQWLSGNATTSVNFAANSFNIALSGTVGAPLFDTYTSRAFTLQPGATFNAAGSGRIDLVQASGLVGQFQSAFFTQPGGQRLDLNIAGSSVDGAFYGPNANEVGGGYRIVGGTPDQRIDILGAFTGR